MIASRGPGRIIGASDRGLAGLMEKMEVTALTEAQHQPMAGAAQAAFEAHVNENLDAKAVELPDTFKAAVDAANAITYLD
ncbi:hypothetical protein [uncultured Tateyamaria sp.]|uniref:hypothetical protein n=1 Tax=Tateyamaria sp. 1078 TaxID=3417464 RepID=UPI0026019749|nr:hypothetical protein [uncultured Tateyamaria sp.]